MHSSRGDWGPEHPRTGVWSLLAVMSDWQHGVDWLLAMYCRCRLRLGLRWCREEWARKVYAMRGLRGVERQVGLTEGPGGQRGQVRAAWWQEKQDKVVDRSRCRVTAHDRNLHAGFAAVHHKTVGLLGWTTKLRPKARRVETGSRRAEKLRCWRTRGRIAGLALGGRGLRRRRCHAMKISATWPICPWGVCITT
jgi:hypothetical protein